MTRPDSVNKDHSVEIILINSQYQTIIRSKISFYHQQQKILMALATPPTPTWQKSWTICRRSHLVRLYSLHNWPDSPERCGQPPFDLERVEKVGKDIINCNRKFFKGLAGISIDLQILFMKNNGLWIYFIHFLLIWKFFLNGSNCF